MAKSLQTTSQPLQSNRRANSKLRPNDTPSIDLEREDFEKPINPIDFELTKKYYGVKKALDVLDEEFIHFGTKKYTVKEFFDLYNQFFYNLPFETHQNFVNRSIHYAFPNGYENDKEREKREIQELIEELQHQIDSTEREHAFINNGSFLMNEIYLSSANSQLDSGGDIFYIQSKRKRKLRSYGLYNTLKTRVRKQQGDILDQDFIVFVNKPTLDGIATGPPINTIGDVNIDMATINTYTA